MCKWSGVTAVLDLERSDSRAARVARTVWSRRSVHTECTVEQTEVGEPESRVESAETRERVVSLDAVRRARDVACVPGYYV